jgi:hypothetical protein
MVIFIIKELVIREDVQMGLATTIHIPMSKKSKIVVQQPMVLGRIIVLGVISTKEEPSTTAAVPETLAIITPQPKLNLFKIVERVVGLTTTDVLEIGVNGNTLPEVVRGVIVTKHLNGRIIRIAPKLVSREC